MTLFHFLNRDKVYTIQSIFQRVFHTIPFDRKKKSMFFGSSECLDSASIHISTSIFDLKKDDNPIFFCDNIYLSSL